MAELDEIVKKIQTGKKGRIVTLQIEGCSQNSIISSENCDNNAKNSKTVNRCTTNCYKLDEIELITLYSLEETTNPFVIEKTTFPSNIFSDFALKYFFRENDKKQDFENEIKSFREIAEIFANGAEIFANENENDLGIHTAIKSVLIGDINCIGFSIKRYSQSESDYYIINDKGEYTLEDAIRDNTLNSDIMKGIFLNMLETVSRISSNNYAHGDIKPDNIMYFPIDSRWKLIDWEYSRKLDFKTLSDTNILSQEKKLGSNPLYWDLLKKFSTKMLTVLNSATGNSISKDYVNKLMGNKKFISVFRESWDSYNSVKIGDIEEDFKKYKGTCDLQSLGLVMYAIYFDSKIKDKVYFEHFCKRLFIFNDNMILNPGDALLEFDKVIKNACPFIKGEGLKGFVYNTCCDFPTPNMLCETLKNQISKPLILYMSDGKSIKSTVSNEFINVIRNDRRHIAKEFISSTLSLSTKGEFKKDYDSFIQVKKIYNDKTVNFTALPDLKYNNSEVYGIEIENGWASKNTRIVFNKKAFSNLVDTPMDVNKILQFVIDIYDSFKILHADNYIHGDIKPANMMYFEPEPQKLDNKEYRLIDWGKIKKCSEYDQSFDYYGSTKMGSPVAFYFSKFTKYVPGNRVSQSISIVKDKNRNEFKTIVEYDNEFKKKYDTIMSNFEKELASRQDDLIFNKWKFNIDLFGFGMSILYLMALSDIKHDGLNELGYKLMEAKNINDINGDINNLKELLKLQNPITGGKKNRSSGKVFTWGKIRKIKTIKKKNYVLLGGKYVPLSETLKFEEQILNRLEK